MKRFLVALTLTCVLAVSAVAGDVPTCGVSAPAPSGTESSAAVTAILAILSIVAK